VVKNIKQNSMAFKLRSQTSPIKQEKPGVIKKAYDKATTKVYGSLSNMEEKINTKLGNPLDKAGIFADEYANKDRSNLIKADKVRHSAAGMYTKEAISKKLGGGILGNAAGIIGSNLLGVGHEISSFNTDHGYLSGSIEGAKDIANNFIGSISNKKNLASNIKKYGNSGMSEATKKERMANIIAEQKQINKPKLLKK
jgi:hypothetical protein